MARQHEIYAEFKREVDIHVADLAAGRATKAYHIKDIAARMHIHPTHLSNTIKYTANEPPCYYFEFRLLETAKEMLADNSNSIAEVARRLTYDPSNFTKFFKHFEGITPKQYREALLAKKYA